MPKLLRVPSALLTALAMLLLWSGTAGAEEPPTTSFTECLATEGSSAKDCLEAEGGLEGLTGDAPKPAAEPVPAAPAPEDLTGPSLRSSTTEGLSPQEFEPQELEGRSAPGAEDLEDLPTDVQEALTCLAGIGQDFVDDLTTLLEENVGSVVMEVGGTLLEFDEGADVLAFLQDPAGFLAGLPGLVEGAVGEIVLDGRTLLEESAADFLACLELLVPEPEPTPEPEPEPEVLPVAVSYVHCDEARAAGAAPVHAGTPGFGAHLDSDDDGVGCEQETVLASSTPTAAPQLAYTGVDAGPMIAGGAALVALGTLAVLAARRPS